MDTEFINAFIDKQRKLIEDLISKNLLAEAKIVLLEKKVSDLSSQIDILSKQEQKKDKAKNNENIGD